MPAGLAGNANESGRLGRDHGAVCVGIGTLVPL